MILILVGNQQGFNILKKKYYKSFIQLNKFVDPAFRLMRFPLEGELDFDFEKWFYWLRKIDLESPLIFVLFLKGKQNKKEKP